VNEQFQDNELQKEWLLLNCRFEDAYLQRLLFKVIEAAFVLQVKPCYAPILSISQILVLFSCCFLLKLNWNS